MWVMPSLVGPSIDWQSDARQYRLWQMVRSTIRQPEVARADVMVRCRAPCQIDFTSARFSPHPFLLQGLPSPWKHPCRSLFVAAGLSPAAID